MIIYPELITDMILRTEGVEARKGLKTSEILRPLGALTIGGVAVEFQGEASMLQRIALQERNPESRAKSTYIILVASYQATNFCSSFIFLRRKASIS
jgi:hypothetical protein